MTRGTCILCIALLAGTACSEPLPPEPLNGTWLSDSASLTVTDSSTDLVLLTSIGCYGSYVHVGQRLGSDRFTLPGTYTHLTGAYPGMVEYASQIAGESQGSSLTLSATVPSIPLTLGPLHLVRGEAPNWPRCLYP